MARLVCVVKAKDENSVLPQALEQYKSSRQCSETVPLTAIFFACGAFSRQLKAIN